MIFRFINLVAMRTIFKFQAFQVCMFLFLGFFLLPSFADAQKRVKTKNEKYFTIQGGIFYDLGKNNIYNEEIDFSSFDFKKLSLGYLAFKKGSVSELLLEASFYEKEFQDLPQDKVKKKKIVIEFEYFKSFLVQNTLENNFHAGVSLAMTYSKEEFNPFATTRYPYSNTCFCLSSGLKAMYVLPISDKIKFLIGTNLVFLEVGYGREYNGNPNIFVEFQTQNMFHRKLFRPRLGLDFGFLF